MKLTVQGSMAAALWLAMCIACMETNVEARAQVFTTTTVQGTVYLANGRPGTGVLQLSWPAFTTANSQAVAAGRMNVTIGADGYVSAKLAPNQGATPAGLYYTAVYHLSDGTTSTEYWLVPAAAQASISQVRAQVMPAAQAVQAVSKGYVDQSITELTQSLLTASGGSLTGPLFLNGDPTQPTQAATKRYVDKEFANALPASGGVASGPLTSVQLGAAYQVDQFSGPDFGAKLQACLNQLDAIYGGTCDARNFTGSQTIGSAVVIATANATVQLPCATIATSNQIRITAATRNVTFHGCALRGASTASGSQGGTVLLYSGAGPMIQAGDPTYVVDTVGFHIDNVVMNTTASTNETAQGLAAYRTQEMNLEGLYLLGNSNQTGMTLDGTGNYTGGTFQDIEFNGFGTALNAIGHQIPNAAPTDWVNASTFVRLHINCPTSGGIPISGTYGINLAQGDGNTFTGGDVEGCGTALHLGPNAQNNTIVGLRNENSIKQVVADAGSSYNNWMTGGTMFTGQLSDNGTRNSFLDTFHRSFNGLNGDWYGSQADATITNHYRVGTGTGNERGLLNRYQSDYGYRWTTGLSDASAGEQFYQVLDELNGVNRISIGQYNHGQASTNNQTVINAAGTGAVVLNGSANAGTGGVIIGSGGATGATVATINSAGNAQFNGTLQVGGPSTFTNSTTVKNQSDSEIDSILWAGSTANQKESFIYKDYSGASQWYMVKDANNNWALNSAVGGLDSFKAYQSSNSGDTYINASNTAGHIRLNYEPGSGSETDIYSGPNATLVAAFLGSNSIKFPGLAAASGRNCLQIDNSGYLSNTGTACGSGGGTNGTVNAGNAGQVAYYSGNGTVIAGTTSVPVNSGGTGATTAGQALVNLGAQAALSGVSSDGGSGIVVSGNVAAGTLLPGGAPTVDLRHPSFAGGMKADNTTDIGPAFQAALNAGATEINIVCGSTTSTYCWWANPPAIVWPASSSVLTVNWQGVLRQGTTLTWPAGRTVHWRGMGGSNIAQFQGPGKTAMLMMQPNNFPAVKCQGTLGTAVSTAVGVKSTVTFSPNPAPSASTCLANGTSITVADNAVCTITSLSRASNIVTAQLSGACHIPAGTPITVAGVSDSSFNGTGPISSPRQFYVNRSDYVKNTMTWRQTGADASSTGGTVTGFNEDTIEHVWLKNCTSTTCDADFYRPHDAVGRWGVDSIASPLNAGSHIIKDIAVTNYDGTSLFMAGSYNALIDSVGLITQFHANITNFALEMQETSFTTFSHISALSGDAPWAVRMTRQQNTPGSGTGPIYIDNSAIGDGIKMDHGSAGLIMKNTFIEATTRAMVTVDPTYYWVGVGQGLYISGSGLQDNGNQIPSCIVYYTTPVNGVTSAVLGRATVQLEYTNNIAANPPCRVNDYFSGTINGKGEGLFTDTNTGTPQGIKGNHDDGIAVDVESRSSGSNMSPVLLPHATKTLNQDPSSWVASPCTVSLVPGPDGVANSAGSYPAGSACATTWTFPVTPQNGDIILYGGWVYTPTPGGRTTVGKSSFSLSNAGSTHWWFEAAADVSGGGGLGTYGQANSDQWESTVIDDWWHPVAAMAKVVNADGTAGTLSFSIGSNNNVETRYWKPWVMYIPASENIPLIEVLRWRKHLLHGYVPSSGAAGQLYTNLPINLPADPTTDSQAANRHYVNSKLGAASSSTLGMMKCDGATTTCDVDGTVHAAITGGGVLTTAGGQTLTAANTVSGLPSGCQQYPCIVQKIDRLNQVANIGNTTAYAVPAGQGGWYRISCNVVVSAAGTGSPTAPGCVAMGTDADTNHSMSPNGGGGNIQLAPSVSGLTIGNVGISNGPYQGGAILRFAASSNILYATSGYAAGSGTPMAYSLHMLIEYLGP